MRQYVKIQGQGHKVEDYSTIWEGLSQGDKTFNSLTAFSASDLYLIFNVSIYSFGTHVKYESPISSNFFSYG